MKENTFAIIEIGSNNTKTHIYENEKNIYDTTTTIEFKKNYSTNKKIDEKDINKLCIEIEKASKYTDKIYVYGRSIFRNISEKELQEIDEYLYKKYNLKISVVSQEEEAALTAYGCYSNTDYNGNICVFIGGGGSTELLIINNRKIIEKKYLDFGVVDITKKFPSLKEDVPTCTLDEVRTYINSLIGEINTKCDVIILAGGDHLYWYNNARYGLNENTLYKSENQKYMINIETSDKYDENAYITSLDRIRANSDNPLWFDGSRAMKAITNVISHKIEAKYVIPTKINMEDGLKNKLINKK